MTNSARAMQKRCSRLLAQLHVQPPVTLRELVGAISEHVGYPITLAPADLPVDAAFGATGSDGSGDVVVYQRNTSTSHQLVIVLHELAHILAGHPRQPVTPPPIEQVSQRLSNLPESMLHLVLGTDQPTPASTELDDARPGLLDELREAAQNTTDPAPALRPEEVTGGLYDDQAEWEAETMATIMIDWLTSTAVYPVSPRLRRLHATMGDA